MHTSARADAGQRRQGEDKRGGPLETNDLALER